MATPSESKGIVTLDVLFRGFNNAHDRFMAEGRLAVDPADAYMPIFEALNWAAALDKRLMEESDAGWSWREGIAEGDIVAGFRFARHRAHHQWADLLYITEGAMLPVPLPMPLYEWRWRKDLPPGRNERGAGVYAAKLADYPARFTLDTMREVFAAGIAM